MRDAATSGPRLERIITGAAIPLLLALLAFTWAQGSRLATIEAKIDSNSQERKTENVQRDINYSNQLSAMDRRITSLEAARGAADQQLTATASAIAGLQAQTSAMQNALSDMRDGIHSIQSDIGALTRATNVPLPGGRR